MVKELAAGKVQGCNAPDPLAHPWIQVVEPQRLPSEWLALDLGAVELSALALALENPNRTVLLDDALARRIGQSAGLTVWGTLRVLLEGKKAGLAAEIAPLVDQLETAGLWMSADIRRRILKLAGEAEEQLHRHTPAISAAHNCTHILSNLPDHLAICVHKEVHRYKDNSPIAGRFLLPIADDPLGVVERRFGRRPKTLAHSDDTSCNIPCDGAGAGANRATNDWPRLLHIRYTVTPRITTRATETV